MTRRERLLAALGCEEADRPPVRVYGATPGAYGQWDASYHRLIDLALEKTEIMDGWGVGGGPSYSASVDLDPKVSDEALDREGYVKRTVTYRTPTGDLHYVDAWSDCGYPRQNMKHLIACEEDAAKFLSIRDEDIPFEIEGFERQQEELGDRGIVTINCNDPGYWVHWMLGSETLAFWSIERRDLVHALYDKVQGNTERHLKRVLLKARGNVVCSGGGGEKWIPPLQSPRDADEFLFPSVKRLAEIVHENGCLLWYHSHGRVRDLIERYAEAGVDCLQPIEPPPMGDVTITEAKGLARGRMSFEGNIQYGDLVTKAPEEVYAMTRAAVAEGRPGGGFILGTSAGFEGPFLSDDEFARWEAYVEAGVAG